MYEKDYRVYCELSAINQSRYSNKYCNGRGSRIKERNSFHRISYVMCGAPSFFRAKIRFEKFLGIKGLILGLEGIGANWIFFFRAKMGFTNFLAIKRLFLIKGLIRALLNCWGLPELTGAN